MIAFPERERLHAMSYALHDDFDRGMQEIVASRLSAGQVFVDVGASVGVLTTIAARMVGASGHVVAIEPLPHLCEAVRGNVARNAVGTPLDLHQNVAFDASGRMMLDLFEEDTRIGTLFAYPAEAFPVGPRARVAVEAVRVDALCPPDRPVDLVKIDAEGAELFVLRSLEGVLERSPGLEIIVEWGPGHFARAGYGGGDVLAWAAARGFSLHLINVLSGALEAFDPASTAANVLMSRKLPG